jgi:hypothetical protein
VFAQFEAVLGMESLEFVFAERIGFRPARRRLPASLAAVDRLLKSLFEVHYDFSSSSLDLRS